MADLFGTPDEGEDDVLAGTSALPRQMDRRQPLATRMRPQTLEDYAGQQHLLNEGGLLRRLIESDRLSAILLHGPPGTGKTTLAHVIAKHSKSRFVQLNAVEATVSDLRKTMKEAERLWKATERRTLLLVDEIHRFNKAQQDVLLPYVEMGTLKLVGATTANPSFSVNAALVSRMQVFELESLTNEAVVRLLKRALADNERGLGEYNVKADKEALEHLAEISDGDARQALNALEVGILTTEPQTSEEGEQSPADDESKEDSDETERPPVHFTLKDAEACIQRKRVRYDADGDQHYDTISAFIKTIRGSEPDAALYLLAKMLHAGEDPRFIARRLIILASEDIGLADPQALPLAVACQQAVEFIGMPEGRIPLSECTLYLATAPKSNASYKAINAALEDVQNRRTEEVPKALRDAHYKGAKDRGHGQGYQYAHDYEEGIAPEAMMPTTGTYYQPTNRGYERSVAERLERWRNLRRDPQYKNEKSDTS